MTRRSSRGVTWSSEISSRNGVATSYRSSGGPATANTRPKNQHGSNYLPATSSLARERSYGSTFSTESSVFSRLSMPKLPQGTGSSVKKKPAGEAWRKHGKLHRAKMLAQDEEVNSFELVPDCKVETYYEIASNVLEQFLKTSVDESKDLAQSYLVGARLVRFLSTVLPTHPDYFSNDPMLLEQRNKSQEQLVHLMQYLDQLALIIDEYEYNRYILKDLNGKDPTDSVASQQAARLSPPASSLLDSTNAMMRGPSASFNDDSDDDSIDSQELFLADIDKEFNEDRQMHLLQVQKDDSSSWDGSYEKYASHHKNPRVRLPRKQELEQPLPKEVSTMTKTRNQNKTKREEQEQPAEESLDDCWNPSFPMSFVGEKIQENNSRNSSRASSWRERHIDSMYSPPLMGEQASSKVGGSVTRGQSPRSAAEFPGWASCNEDVSADISLGSSHAVMGYLELLVDDEERPPPSDALSVAASEEEELSLTGRNVTKRKQQLSLSKFKGCLKCLLDY